MVLRPRVQKTTDATPEYRWPIGRPAAGRATSGLRGVSGESAELVRVTASPVPRVVIPWVDEPELSVVIVAFGTGLALDRCLGSLGASITADEIAAEVIVVDNAHPQRGHAAGNRTAIASRGVRLIQPSTNLGFGGGNNAGVAVARASTLALINPDVIVAPGQLRALLNAARSRPDLISAPALIFPDGALQEMGMRIINNGDTRPILESGSHPPDYASAACWFLSAELFSRLEGFDPAYHPAYYEDVDFALRAAQLGGGTQVIDSVLVVHEHHGSTTSPPDVAKQQQVFLDRWQELVASRPPQ